MSKVPYSDRIPEPTSAPLITAFGVALIAAGLVTNGWVMAGGAVLLVFGLIGWFRDVFPGERTEDIPVPEPSSPSLDFTVGLAATPAPRPLYPAQVHSYRSGIVGGLIGGVAMAIVSMGWGITSHGGIWLPINLLAGIVAPSVGSADEAALRLFNGEWLAIALGIHAALSIAVGVLFTVALPIAPRRPIVAGGVIVPIISTGMVWATLATVNPTLDAHISWPWFIASEFAFGVACGWWVGGRTPVAAHGHGSLADRLDIHRGGKR